MRVLKLVVALALVVVIQVMGARWHPDFPRAVSLFAALVVLNALDGNSLAGMLGGLAAGLTHDALSGNVFGFHGFADTILGYGVARLAQHLVIQNPLNVLAVTALASLAEEAILVALSALLLPQTVAGSWLWLLVRAVTTGVVAMIAYILGQRWSQRALRPGRRKRRRWKLG